MKVYGEGNLPLKQSLTGDDGKYYIEGLKQGNYVIDVESDGSVFTKLLNLTDDLSFPIEL